MPSKKTGAKSDKETAPKAATKAKATAKSKAAPKAKAESKTAAKKAAPKAESKTAAKKAAPKAEATAKAKAKAPAKKPAAKAKATSKAAPKKAATSKPATDKKVARAVGSVQKFDNFKPYKPSRGESYMNEEQLEHFKQILLNWRGELVDEVSRTVTHMKDEAANFPDPADRATQEEEFSLELRTRDRERKLIKKIDSTLERIQIDDYGYCDACGIEIGIQRLEARPTATLCIDCKTLAEIKEKQELG
jgi:DnaK suppressor protein